MDLLSIMIRARQEKRKIKNPCICAFKGTNTDKICQQAVKDRILQHVRDKFLKIERDMEIEDYSYSVYRVIT